MIRVGVDVGGTFTDLVMLDEASGDVRAIKVPSTSRQEHLGFAEGLRQLAEGSAIVDQIVHGTTVATNALLQRKGGRVAMVCTRGFRDVLEIGRCMRYAHGSLFDAKFVKPAPLVERAARFEVRERVAADGAVVAPLELQSVDDVIAALRIFRPDCIVIGLINAYANDAHERQLRDVLRQSFPQAQICISSEVHRGHQEFERFATAALNAFLMPPMASYMSLLRETLTARGHEAPILIMSSAGGALTPAAASAFPVRTILSGPVGGVTAAIALSNRCNLPNLITYDMGGTSTDVCVVRNGAALTTDQVVFGGLPVRGAMLQINTVGAGAGSIAMVDAEGVLHVGPESAGAVPGPVCYDAGGDRLTVTDANLFLGRLNHDHALGGTIRLKPAPVADAMAKLGAQLGIAAGELAEGILRIAVAKMAGAIREISVARGLDPRGFALLAYGGAGPMHAAFVAEELGIREVVAPPLPGNFSAVGLLEADLRWEEARSTFLQLDETGAAALRAAVGELKSALALRVAEDVRTPAGVTHEITIDMHYAGQASAFAVRIDEPALDVESLKAAFLVQYRERYGHANESRAISVDGVRVVAVMRTHASMDRGAQAAAKKSATVAARSRTVTFNGSPMDCAIFERSSLAPEWLHDGPAIIEENGATTVVPPGWKAWVDAFSNLRLTKMETRP